MERVGEVLERRGRERWRLRWWWFGSGLRRCRGEGSEEEK